MPQQDLLKLLEGIGSGIGMDASIVPSSKYPDMFVISTTDFFYPLVEDPFEQVRDTRHAALGLPSPSSATLPRPSAHFFAVCD